MQYVASPPRLHQKLHQCYSSSNAHQTCSREVGVAQLRYPWDKYPQRTLASFCVCTIVVNSALALKLCLLANDNGQSLFCGPATMGCSMHDYTLHWHAVMLWRQIFTSWGVYTCVWAKEGVAMNRSLSLIPMNTDTPTACLCCRVFRLWILLGDQVRVVYSKEYWHHYCNGHISS